MRILLLVWLSLGAVSAAAQEPSAETYAYGEATADQVLDLAVPAVSGFPTVLFVHGGSLVEIGDTRSSEVYREVCRPFVRLLLEENRPADLVIVPGRQTTSIGSIARDADSTFAAIHAFIRTGDPRAALHPDVDKKNET